MLPCCLRWLITITILGIFHTFSTWVPANVAGSWLSVTHRLFNHFSGHSGCASKFPTGRNVVVKICSNSDSGLPQSMPSMLFSLVFTPVFTSSQCEIFDQSSTMVSNPMLHFVWHVQQHCGQNVNVCNQTLVMSSHIDDKRYMRCELDLAEEGPNCSFAQGGFAVTPL